MKKLMLCGVFALCGFSLSAQQWYNQSSNTTTRLRSIAFSTDTTGLSMGDTPTTIRRTVNAGDNWTTPSNLYNDGNIHKLVYQSPPATIIAVGNDAVTGGGVVMRSTSAGTTWLKDNNYGRRMWDIVFSPANNQLGWIAAEAGWIYDCIDGGVVWDSSDTGSGENMKGIHFVSSANGFTVGNGGVFYNTLNSGLNWNSFTTGTTNNLNNVWFSTDQIGLVIGNAGTALGTINAGGSWIPMTTGTTEDLYGLSFLDATTGWLVGGNGTIINTIDNGFTWNPQTSPTTEILRSVYMRNDTLGWACGDNGTILIYTTGPAPGILEDADKLFNVKVYPNPSNDVVNVVCNDFNNAWSYTLLDLNGREIMEVTDISTSSAAINHSKVASGTYMLEVRNDNGQSGIQKVIFE